MQRDVLPLMQHARLYQWGSRTSMVVPSVRLRGRYAAVDDHVAITSPPLVLQDDEIDDDTHTVPGTIIEYVKGKVIFLISATETSPHRQR
jgi:hypothetical protein